jgi:hypothetical protein
MKPGIVVDASSFKKALTEININASELLQIEGTGAYVLVNGMRMRVPVDTAATKNSVSPHIVESSDVRVVDEVGPETDYAPAIEMGIPSKPNYPLQPFVRPTAFEDFEKVIRAIGTAFGQFIISRWPK